MMKAEDVEQFIASKLPAIVPGPDVHGEGGYALPEASRAVLLACVSQLGIRKIFEFGSGRSTRDFLRAGCEVTVVEDSQAWLDGNDGSRSMERACALRRRICCRSAGSGWRALHCGVGCFRKRRWQTLREAELVLVDSPAWPPFREHALVLALAHCRAALIVVDDANIPTVSRFLPETRGTQRRALFSNRDGPRVVLHLFAGKGFGRHSASRSGNAQSLAPLFPGPEGRMKILLSSHFFAPSVGGIETVSEILAREFIQAGHEVKVVTQTKEDDGAPLPFAVYRRPGPATLLRLVAVVRRLFPQQHLAPNRVAATHPEASVGRCASHLDRPRGWRHWLARSAEATSWFATRAILPRAKALCAQIAAPAVVIGNPYRDDLFRCDPHAVRDGDLIFVGRLVYDKGADLLFHSLARLRELEDDSAADRGRRGPEETDAPRLVRATWPRRAGHFCRETTGPEFVALLNRHRVIVVPSRWQEPFGLVALEGLACGCVALVARCGGLPDAVGAAGVSFRHEDVDDAAARIEELLDPRADWSGFHRAAPGHLIAHTARAVAQKYLEVIEEAMRR